MVYYLPATKVSQQNYKVWHSIAGPILNFLFKWLRIPSRMARGRSFQLHFQAKALVSKDSASPRKTACSFQPKFLSIWPDTKLPSDIWSSLEIWELRIIEKKKQVGFSLISHSIKKMIFDCGYMAPWYISGGSPQTHPQWGKLLLGSISRILPQRNYTPGPKTFIRKSPSGQSDPRQSPPVSLALPTTCDFEICLL